MTKQIFIQDEIDACGEAVAEARRDFIAALAAKGLKPGAVVRVIPDYSPPMVLRVDNVAFDHGWAAVWGNPKKTDGGWSARVNKFSVHSIKAFEIIEAAK